jgi:hypothetical protein
VGSNLFLPQWELIKMLYNNRSHIKWQLLAMGLILVFLIIIVGCLYKETKVFLTPEEALFSINQGMRIIDKKPLGNDFIFFAKEKNNDYIVRVEHKGNGWVVVPGISSSSMLSASDNMNVGIDTYKSEDEAKSYTLVYGTVYNPNIFVIEIHFPDSVIMKEMVNGEGFLVVREGFYLNRGEKIRVLGLDDKGNKMWQSQ